MRYVVQYELPYTHRVQVGIEADSPEAAVKEAERLFDEGEIWDDTATAPLLYDDYEEEEDSGTVLEFEVVATLGSDEPWPTKAPCVKFYQDREKAMRVAQMLVEAYRTGAENGGSIDWSDIDDAYALALKACGESAEEARHE
ncbi:MAG: hypothetical protein B7Z66_12190 [Chromatiales bacterium 21-64-14]|nr:MAG: hypothetical protein B7Z66_12190 [Chromatiales bacterium 21-64-14]HQU15476.1 hypothetical protein [Gammaproteobacteria bacterium]